MTTISPIPSTVTVTTAPATGTAVVTGASPGAQAGIRIEYTASGGATGTDAFEYTVLNPDGQTSDTAMVFINLQPADTVPDAFVFVDQSVVPLASTITSAPVTITGIDSPAPVSVTNGVYSINGGAFVSAPGTVSNNNTVRVRHASSDGARHCGGYGAQRGRGDRYVHQHHGRVRRG